MDHKTFIDKIAETTAFGREECESFLEAFIGVMEGALSEGDTISLPAFGNFDAHKRNERIMNNPSQPGKRLLIPPKLVINFKPSVSLKNKINKKDIADG